jgi:biopolymer transport protein ExbD
MRRYSKKHSLVTLSDINITPMLDLAFVLLIIFVISTPLLEQGMNLDLPEGGGTDTQQPEVKKTIEISPAGRYELDGEQMTLVAIEQALVQAHRANANTVIYIRVDEDGRNKHLYDVIDVCQRNNLTKFSLRTRPKS